MIMLINFWIIQSKHKYHGFLSAHVGSKSSCMLLHKNHRSFAFKEEINDDFISVLYKPFYNISVNMHQFLTLEKLHLMIQMKQQTTILYGRQQLLLLPIQIPSVAILILFLVLFKRRTVFLDVTSYLYFPNLMLQSIWVQFQLCQK